MEREFSAALHPTQFGNHLEYKHNGGHRKMNPEVAKLVEHGCNVRKAYRMVAPHPQAITAGTDLKQKKDNMDAVQTNLFDYDKAIKELKEEPAAELRRLQRMPFSWKVEHAKNVIREFVEHEGESHVYVSFSGGKDSLVTLHLVRSIYPDVPAVFANTGIEFPEQVKFVRSFQNVTEVHPIKHFPKILKEHGIVYPSKEVAMYIRDAKNGVRYAINGLRGLDTKGNENRYKARFKRWAYLLDSGVKISPVCCELMKEQPLRDYEKRNGKSPIIGTRSEESFSAVGWMKSGCNSFVGKKAKSTPLSLWMESDVWRYIDENSIKLSPMYTEGGMSRTGCMFCPVPIAHKDMKNIEYARTHHPKMYDAMMHKFGLADMLKKCMEAE